MYYVKVFYYLLYKKRVVATRLSVKARRLTNLGLVVGVAALQRSVLQVCMHPRMDLFRKTNVPHWELRSRSMQVRITTAVFSSPTVPMIFKQWLEGSWWYPELYENGPE